MPRKQGTRRAADLARAVGGDIRLARAIAGLNHATAAARAGLSRTTFAAVEDGRASARLDTLAAACAAVGLSLSLKAFPAAPLSLRDSGQLAIVGAIRARASPAWRSAMEYVVDDRLGRAADLVMFGPDEILHFEVERRVLDWQAQYRAARVKHSSLTDRHRRPVRLVMAIEDTRANRARLEPHLPLLRSELAGGSRDVWGALESGRALGRDALVWIRRRRT